MPRQLMLRPLTSEEQEQLTKLSRSRTAAQRLVERAQIILAVQAGSRRAAIAQQMGRDPDTITRQVQRFNRLGLAGLQDEARPGRPLVYSESERGAMIAAARTHPQSLGQPFGHWSLSRLVQYVQEQLHLTISRAQLARVLEAEGLKWYQEQTYFTERPDPQFAEKRGP